MSSITWTPPAVATEAKPATLALWRAVEAQHVVATRALVNDLAEQELLEALLDESKPEVPPACARLDYLLFTPFRYPSNRYGSRFRAFTDPGVWYGAENLRTACAEVGYWRWRFVQDSQGLKRLDAVAHSLFQASAAGIAIDVRDPPFADDRVHWTDPADYTGCQALARTVRAASVAILRYGSVRDPSKGGCAAVLDCRAFVGQGGPRRRQTWFLTIDETHASWVRSYGGGRREDEAFEFSFG